MDDEDEFAISPWAVLTWIAVAVVLVGKLWGSIVTPSLILSVVLLILLLLGRLRRPR